MTININTTTIVNTNTIIIIPNTTRTITSNMDHVIITKIITKIVIIIRNIITIPINIIVSFSHFKLLEGKTKRMSWIVLIQNCRRREFGREKWTAKKTKTVAEMQKWM